MRLRVAVVVVGCLSALGAMLVTACTTHGEGGRCSQLNNNTNNTTGQANLDCDPGLVCTNAADITLPDSGGQKSGADICCPSDRSTATTDICKLSPISPGSDASIPDGGDGGTVSDTGIDQSVSDAATDATDGSIQDAADDGG